ncbi:MAG: EAL domain-containing protein [Magnetococcales bacterium]|nr:EAL domain-containing protein [Magnetococcales bacterium]
MHVTDGMLILALLLQLAAALSAMRLMRLRHRTWTSQLLVACSLILALHQGHDLGRSLLWEPGFDPSLFAALTALLIALLMAAGISGVGRLIRSLQQTESRLQESLESLSRAQAIAQVGAWEWNILTNELTWSDEIFRIFGHPPQAFIPDYAAFLRAIHPADVDRVEREVQRALEHPDHPYNVEHRILRPDGSLRIVHEKGEVIRDPSGKPLVMMGAVHDITELRRVEEHLHTVTQTFHEALGEMGSQMELAAKVFEHAIEGVTITNAENVILSVNPAFCAITGYASEEVIGQTPRLLRSDRHEPAFYAEMWKTLARDGFWQGEIWNRRKSGEAFPEHLTITSVRDEQGRPTHYIALFHDLSDLRRSEEALHLKTFYDALTGLPNRELFRDRLRMALRQARRTKRRIGVVVFDLDLFKHVNDTLGHISGDLLLQEAGARMTAALREGDAAARLGGDEFALLLEELADAREAAHVVQRVFDHFLPPFVLSGTELYVTLSAGIAIFPDNGEDADLLLRNADMALHRAKDLGRRNFQFHTPEMDARVNRRLRLENDMRKGLERGEFLLFYQPKIDTAGMKLGGMEALARWKHPEQGMISPADFIPVAEETGLIVPMGEWILREACRQAQAWVDAGLPPMTVAVNLSARQFREANLLQMVDQVLAESGLVPEQLELEITESMVMSDVEQAIDTMRALRERGVRIAVDDFGTGYSSLNYLKRFPVHALKVDQHFIKDVITSGEDAAIVAGVIRLAHSLGLEVVAEGVELREHVDFLRQLACETLQGYYFSRPLPSEEFAAFARRWGEKETLPPGAP